jgi:hypothetical protein
VSNPCFEFWLLLHFEYHVQPILNGDAACKLLGRHIRNYRKGFNCFDEVIDKTDTGIEHARRIFRERYQFDNPHPCDCHPSTQVHELVESLKGEA